MHHAADGPGGHGVKEQKASLKTHRQLRLGRRGRCQGAEVGGKTWRCSDGASFLPRFRGEATDLFPGWKKIGPRRRLSASPDETGALEYGRFAALSPDRSSRETAVITILSFLPLWLLLPPMPSSPRQTPAKPKARPPPRRRPRRARRPRRLTPPSGRESCSCQGSGKRRMRRLPGRRWRPRSAAWSSSSMRRSRSKREGRRRS